MKQCWMRWTAAVVALVMMLTMFPVQWTVSAKAEDGFGVTTADGVFLRKQPGSSSYWFKLPKGFKCAVLGTETKKGVLWYKVRSDHPTSGTSNTYVGYIHSDYFTTELSDDVVTDTTVPSSPEQEEDKDTSADTTVTRVGEVKGAAEVNFRKTPNTTEDNIYQTLPEGTLVQVLEVPEVMDENHWVKVVYDGKEGYIMASYLTVSGQGSTTTDPDAGKTDGDASTGDTNGSTGDTGTSTPTATVITVGEVNADNVNFRKTEGGALIDKLQKGTRVEVLTIPAGTSSNYWYKVSYDGKTGYIQAPYVTVLGTTSGSVNDLGYVKLILNSANLRVAPGGKIAAQWTTPGETLPVTGTSQTQGGYTWYPVLYKGSYYFVRNDCVLLVSGISSGNSGSTGSTTVTPTLMGYLKTIKSGVNLRSQPAGKVLAQIKKGTVIKRMSDAVTADGSTWYLVEVDGTIGYMRSDCVTFVNEDGSAADAPTVTTPPTTDSTTSTYGYVITVKSSVNLRSKPAGSSKTQIALGVILPMTGYSVKSGMYYWYPVRTADGLTGYVRGDCVTYCTSDGTATTEPNQGDGTVTTAPSLTTYGYVMIKSNSVNVRKTPGGSSQGQVDKNTVWPMTGYSTTYGGYTWYPINANGLTGYVRGDHSFKLSAAQEESYLAGNGVPSEGGIIGGNTAVTTTQYVQTTLDKVYLRASATKDSDHLFQVELGTVMSFDQKQTVGGSVWYRVIYGNKQVWVLGDCVKVMTSQEYADYLASNPSSTPQTQIILGYVKTTTSKVNVRTKAGGSSKLGQIDKDLVMPYSAVETAKGYTWYYASTSLGKGYLRSDCVVVCDQDGNTVTGGGSTGDSTGGSSSGLTEATYTTLKKGSKGTAVKNLVTELKNQGYYTGEITSSYTTAVVNAVKAFQAAKGLDVDGIAGSKTQHALYGTVPVGTVNSGDLSFTIYPAEKIDWYTGGIQNLWKKGASYKIYDVKTGIVWWAKRWSGAYHADIEPLTAADTARLCKIYGVSSADQINDSQHWYRRPCLVTIGTHTYAASLYGVPHNYPDGDTIADNDMKGQICLHFTNSKIHGSGQVDTNHQKAIEEAYQYAKNGDPR